MRLLLRRFATPLAFAVLLLGCAGLERSLQRHLAGADTPDRLVYELEGQSSAWLFALLERNEQDLYSGDVQNTSHETEIRSGTATPAEREPVKSHLELVDFGRGRARATLLLSSGSPQADGPIATHRAAYGLQIPASELSLILQDLRSTGVFDRRERPEGGAWLDVQTSRQAFSKDWTPEPRLDELAERVLLNGRPIDAGRSAPSGQARLTASSPPR